MLTARCTKRMTGRGGPACGGELRFGTDQIGRTVEICDRCARRARGICLDCPARTNGKAVRCPRCGEARKLQTRRDRLTQRDISPERSRTISERTTRAMRVFHARRRRGGGRGARARPSSEE